MNARPSDVRKALAGAEYPASPDELVAVAEQHDAPEEVLEDLGELSEDEYASQAAVLAELAGEGDEDEE
ncbi:MAG TPA: DUF2795 domain-containing protein [Solirubrobacteraceae bacterium]|jgi:hypothetical protein